MVIVKAIGICAGKIMSECNVLKWMASVLKRAHLLFADSRAVFFSVIP